MKKPLNARPNIYATIFEPLKLIAKGLGYNLVLHGSLNRDMDLIAIPWTDNPGTHKDLIIAMDVYLNGVNMVWDTEEVPIRYKYSKLPGGRHSYVIDLNRGGPWNSYVDEQYYLDISITPFG